MDFNRDKYIQPEELGRYILQLNIPIEPYLIQEASFSLHTSLTTFYLYPSLYIHAHHGSNVANLKCDLINR